MGQLPANLAFFGGESQEEIKVIWTDQPLPPNGYTPAFFSSDLPFFATKFAIDTYGEETLLLCLAYLREKAIELGGIGAFQRLLDIIDSGPSILFVEDYEDDFSQPEGQKPWRILIFLNDEFLVYEEVGGEWLGLARIPRQH